MEAMVTFNLKERKKALVVPKDTVVIVGNNSVVFTIADNMVLPLMFRLWDIIMAMLRLKDS